MRTVENPAVVQLADNASFRLLANLADDYNGSQGIFMHIV